jgi:transcriptional regulator with XRE-family HTH domain
MWTKERLKALRKARGLTQPEFAMLLGVSPRTYERWEGKGHPGLGWQKWLEILEAEVGSGRQG